MHEWKRTIGKAVFPIGGALIIIFIGCCFRREHQNLLMNVNIKKIALNRRNV